MRLLLLRARSDGPNAIEGLVRADNVAMLALAKSLRFATLGTDDPTVRLVRRALQKSSGARASDRGER